MTHTEAELFLRLQGAHRCTALESSSCVVARRAWSLRARSFDESHLFKVKDESIQFPNESFKFLCKSQSRKGLIPVEYIYTRKIPSGSSNPNASTTKTSPQKKGHVHYCSFIFHSYYQHQEIIGCQWLPGGPTKSHSSNLLLVASTTNMAGCQHRHRR